MAGHALHLYQVSKIYLRQYQSYRADMISIRKITMGNNYAKNVDGVTIFKLCMLSGHALHFYEFL